MLSSKKNVLQTVALLKAYGIKHIVLSPGSRNAPLIQTFTQDSFFDCHLVVDERNAAFYGLGIIQYTQQPVVICCTSGSALLNYAPAISEAFYQQLPLIVISADRSPEWIGQMDGQTMPQANIFPSLVKKSVHLPEIKSETDEWYCNRLINEALITCTDNAKGPVHINIPLSEPLFDYMVEQLPPTRKIEKATTLKSVNITPFAEKWNNAKRRMIVVGQQLESKELTAILKNLAEQSDCVICSEHPSNISASFSISNFDTLLCTFDEAEQADYAPDLLITFGGHIISKRLKHFLRKYKPQQHWLLNESGQVADLFQSLTDLLEVDTFTFISDLLERIEVDTEKPFSEKWHQASLQIPQPSDDIPYSDLWVTGEFIKHIPKKAQLHLANSSSIRNAQLFSLPDSVTVYANRGINGIESTLPTAIGFAAVCSEPVYLMIGDLSFFYSVGALWNISHIKTLRILLLNNKGGEIFHLLPKLNESSSLNQYVAAGHECSAHDWALAAGFSYLSATDKNNFSEHLNIFMNEKKESSTILEVLTDTEVCKEVFQSYFHQLKNNR